MLARLCLSALALWMATAVTAVASPCEEAGAAAEKAHNLPSGLLLAIGQVESGRRDPVTGRVAAWPWTIDVAGEGRYFSNAAEAVQVTTRLRDQGVRNIDVGCFQVSLLHHPRAFRDLDEAFDPMANAHYAGRFLASLKEQSGSWESAVAAYHSADPARGIPYRQQVFARWRDAPPIETAEVEPAQPAVVAFGIRVWTPSRPGRAPGLVAMNPAAPELTADTTAMPGTVSLSSGSTPGWRMPKVVSQR